MSCYKNSLKIILLLFWASEIGAFGRPKSYKYSRKSSTVKGKGCNENDESFEKSDRVTPVAVMDHDPYCSCTPTGFGVVQKIPYRSSPSVNGPMDIDLSSSCIRCAICLAVAEQINQSLADAHGAIPPDKWFDDDEAHSYLTLVCDEDFTHYALREYNGERYLGESLAGATLVVTTEDGSWDNSLKERCHDIVDEVGPENLYKHWRHWFDGSTSPLVDFLCRSESGVLHDCRNIGGTGYAPEICPYSYGASIKVTAGFERSIVR